MDKKELRKKIRELSKPYINSEYAKEASSQICSLLWQHPLIQKAQHIALYHALPDEPDLNTFIQKLASTKKLYLPRVEGDEIAFYPYTNEENLATGSYGIAEPTHTKEEAVDPANIELILVPGLAFTHKGVRLGRGKAYYDRFLPKTNATRIGITFRFRLIDEIPHDAWDCLMHHVITN